MSVYLDIGNLTRSRGWAGDVNLNIINSGTENIMDMTLKVTDSQLFTTLKVNAIGGFKDCLNVYTTSYILLPGEVLPAGTAKSATFRMSIKAGAPIEVHQLPCAWIFTVY